MNNGKNMIKRASVLLVTCIYATSATSMSMQEVFDGVNAQGNVSSPAVIQGQTMNMYTGGSMFMRAPKRTYNIASFTAPDYNTGCGGIDLFAGGFSFINKEQFVAMLRNIGSNALGYGFKLAIQNLCPTCDNVMQALQATAQAMNRLNIDSCEAAKGLVNATIPSTWDKEKTNTAKMFGVDSSTYSDVTDAWANVAKSLTKTNEGVQKAGEDHPELKDGQPTGNVVWNALKKAEGLDNQYKMLIMSMIGTTIFRTDTSVGPVIVERKPITVAELIGGNTVNEATGEKDYRIQIDYWKCDEPVDCLNVSPAKTDKIDSFRSMVDAKMSDLVKHIAERKPYEDPIGMRKFINATDIPVYKLLATVTSLDNVSLAENAIGKYQELIAAKYAEVYIKMAAEELLASFAKYSAQAGLANQEVMKELRPRIEKIQDDAAQAVRTAYSQTVSTYNIAQEIAFMERAMHANLSQNLRSSLAYAKGLR